MFELRIAEDFSPVPAGRFVTDGPYSGQKFREEVLVMALRRNPEVKVVLDGAEGYGSSFLEEAFGGLVREGVFTAEELHRKLSFEASPNFRFYANQIWECIDAAAGGRSVRRIG